MTCLILRPCSRGSTLVLHRAALSAPAVTARHLHGVGRRPGSLQLSHATPGSILVADTLSFSHDGEKVLFENASFTLSDSDRVAVVGPNGCGKSSLLRVLADVEKPDSGEVSLRKSLRVGYLPQDPQLDPSATAVEAVLLSDAPAAKAVRRYLRAAAAAEEGGGAAGVALQDAMNEMNALNGWQLEDDARRALRDMGLTDQTQLVGTMSGGQQRRVALAAALLSEPDLLILDEPTNHMDVGIVEWLERQIKSRSTGILLITHDRAFMENVCTKVLEMDFGRVIEHSDFGGEGSYFKLRQAVAERRHAERQAAANATTVLRKESEWMSRQPQGRQTKARAREARFYQLSDAAKAGPKVEKKVEFGVEAMSRQGSKIMIARDVRYELPDGSRTIIRRFDHEFGAGQRWGICGPNGSGKSTFLNLVAGQLPLTDGSIDTGETTVVGYFEQYPPEVPPTVKIIDYITDIEDKAPPAPDADIPEVLLEKLGFPRSKQQQLVSSLSGGEMRRLHLAGVLTKRPNFLILDEPTNDLDLGTVEVLEELLRGYKGVLLCASHDRTFMNNLTDTMFVLEGDGEVRKFDGTYDDYLAYMKQQAKAAEAAAEEAKAAARVASAREAAEAAAPVPPKKSKRLKMGFRDAEDLKRLEAELPLLEERVAELTREMTTAGGDFEKLAELTAQQAKLQEELDVKSDRWMELAELAETCISP